MALSSLALPTHVCLRIGFFLVFDAGVRTAMHETGLSAYLPTQIGLPVEGRKGVSTKVGDAEMTVFNKFLVWRGVGGWRENRPKTYFLNHK